MFNLHIPLGIGGLSIVAYLWHRPVLDPQTEVSYFILIMRITIHTGLKISVTKGVKDRMNLIPLLTNAVTPALRIC